MYAECYGAVQRFCYFKLPSKVEGDDVIQEVALAAWSHRKSIQNTDAFKSWLLRITANKCKDFYRKRYSRLEMLLEEASEISLCHSQYGLTVVEVVQETIEQIGERDAQILQLYYVDDFPQAEIARLLGIPVGTVKSRLHTAKKRFKDAYPFPPTSKGDIFVTKLPEVLPKYTIKRLNSEPFPVKWEENMGFFYVPRLGEKLSWAMYDYPGRTRSEMYDIEVVGRASVHGVEGVEVVVSEKNGGEHEGHEDSRNLIRTFVAQLTETHSRVLSESHMEGDIKRIWTFLDSEEFLPNWGFGEDNCGKEIDIKQRGIIRRDGDAVITDKRSDLLDVVGRYAVTIGGKEYDCVCVMDVAYYNPGVVSEQFVDKNGRTVLWRRFNRDDWKIDRYKQRWSERFPDNIRLTVNGELYIHWYDCVTNYVL